MNTEDEKVGPVDTGAQQADVAAQAAANQVKGDDAKPPETDDTNTADAADTSGEENTGEEGDPDNGDNPGEGPTELEKALHAFRRQKNKLTRKAGEALLRVQELEQALAQRDAQVQQKPAVVEQQAPSEKPTLESCDFDTELHADRLYEWKRDQERRQEAQSKAQVTARERAAQLAEQEDAFAASVPDYFEVSRAPNVPINQMVVDILMENPETAPAIAYHLGKHLTEAAAIAQMSPAAAGRAIGRIEASLSASVSTATTPSRPVTQAPAPVATLKPGAPLRKSLEDLPMDQYVAERNRQLKAKGLRN